MFELVGCHVTVLLECFCYELSMYHSQCSIINGFNESRKFKYQFQYIRLNIFLFGNIMWLIDGNELQPYFMIGTNNSSQNIDVQWAYVLADGDVLYSHRSGLRGKRLINLFKNLMHYTCT